MGDSIKDLRSLLMHVYNTRWAQQPTGEQSYNEALRFVEATELPLERVSRSDVACYAASITNVKASTVNRKMRPVVTMLREGVSLGLISEDVMRGWSWKKEDDPGFYVLSEIEEQFFRENLSLDALDLFDVLIQTGMRVGEALNLRRGDIHWCESHPYVQLHADRVKSRRARRVYLTEWVARLLQERSKDTDPFEGYTYDKFHMDFSQAREAAGITDPRCTPHCLRHTCATRLLKRGANIATVGKWLGHSDVRTTLRYVHADTDDLQEAAQLLSR